MYSKDLKIGVLGSGIVGRVLGAAFHKEGHAVMIGTRDTSKEEIAKWLSENPGTQAGSFESTAVFGDIIVLATPGVATLEIIEQAGKNNFTGKTIIDATNPIAAQPPVNGVLSFFTDYNSSLLEQIQALLPYANPVKAFSSVGNAFMYKPNFLEGTPSMFIAGNSEEAKATVTTILTHFGWETEDMGKAEAARAIEPLCILWCLPGFTKNQWHHAFKLLKK
ncbi:MAG: NADPH-dependent F420 reductase [Sediminibacterium sp.]|jgi:predicted dinucleotide-binding enzyme|nr:NAD(P)-binding domain-containing protein [Chitinophagaceae bacterium]MCA6445756.1 NAD(P)-binding domain-containing protein [Chitinophagaceae bacterium]